jgi:hypothetical protein
LQLSDALTAIRTSEAYGALLVGEFIRNDVSKVASLRSLVKLPLLADRDLLLLPLSIARFDFFSVFFIR